MGFEFTLPWDAVTATCLVEFLKACPILARQEILFNGHIKEYPLYFVVVQRGTLSQVQQVYDMYPEALLKSEDLLQDACGEWDGRGVAYDVLEFLVQRMPAVTHHDIGHLLTNNYWRTDYPLVQAAELLLEACSDTPADAPSEDFEWSLLGSALAFEQSREILDLLVTKTVPTNTFGGFGGNLCFDEGRTTGRNFCPVTPSVAAALYPLLTTVTKVGLGVNMRDIEGCIAILDYLAVSPVLEELSLRVQAMNSGQQLALRLGDSFRNLLSKQKTLQMLHISCCEGVGGGDHDFVMNALYEARHLLSPKLNKLQIGCLLVTKWSQLHKMFLEGCLPEVVVLLGLVEVCTLDSWEEPLGAAQPSSTKKFTFEGQVSREWIEHFLPLLRQNMPLLEDLNMECSVSGCYNATAEVVSLLQVGALKHIDLVGVELDLSDICECLKTNTSLKDLSYCTKHVRVLLEDVELLRDVLRDHNTTLEAASAVGQEQGAALQVAWGKVNYYTDLNRLGRKNMRAPSLSLCQCVSVLCEAANEAAKTHTTIQYSGESEEVWQERVTKNTLSGDIREVGMMYGFLHESVSIWSATV